jgi:hypothetical protein
MTQKILTFYRRVPEDVRFLIAVSPLCALGAAALLILVILSGIADFG